MDVVFFREDSFYPISLPDDASLADHAKANPGTKRVTDVNGKVLWEQEGYGGN